MSNEAHKQTVRAYLKALGSGDGELFRSVITDDYVAHIRGHSEISGTQGRDQVLGFVAAVPTITKDGIDFKVLSLTAEDVAIPEPAVHVTGQM